MTREAAKKSGLGTGARGKEGKKKKKKKKNSCGKMPSSSTKAGSHGLSRAQMRRCHQIASPFGSRQLLCCEFDSQRRQRCQRAAPGTLARPHGDEEPLSELGTPTSPRCSGLLWQLVSFPSPSPRRLTACRSLFLSPSRGCDPIATLSRAAESGSILASTEPTINFTPTFQVPRLSLCVLA